MNCPVKLAKSLKFFKLSKGRKGLKGRGAGTTEQQSGEPLSSRTKLANAEPLRGGPRDSICKARAYPARKDTGPPDEAEILAIEGYA